MCFEDQKREMASIGSTNSFVNTLTASSGLIIGNSGESTPRGLYATYRNQSNAVSMNGNFSNPRMDNMKSNTMPSISTTLKSTANGPVTIASTDIYFDSEPEEFEDEEDEEPFHRRMPLLSPRRNYLSSREIINGGNDVRKIMNGNLTRSKKSQPPPLPIKPKLLEKPEVPAKPLNIPINRTNIHITPGTANCHNANSVSSKLVYFFVFNLNIG